MDTDSAYIAFSDEFENLIKPELLEDFAQNRHKWFCDADTARQPGLFKREYEGDGIIAIRPKLYHKFNGDNVRIELFRGLLEC